MSKSRWCSGLAWLLLATLLVCLGVLIYVLPDTMRKTFSPSHFIRHVSLGKTDYSEEVTYWEGRIAEMGGKAAYEELASGISRFSILDQHVEAHTFGEALYKREPVEGFTVCDNQFGQGCWHAFFTTLVKGSGLQAGLSQLERRCAEEDSIAERRTCDHGIGHAIESYMGYTSDALQESLTQCANLERHTDLGLGCYGGVFMEYNLHVMLQFNETAPKQPSSGVEFLQPCTSVSSQYQDACMFWQPFWWRRLLDSKERHELYSLMGAHCDSAITLSSSAVESCFKGVGYAAPLVTNYDATATVDACAAVSGTAVGRVACWSWAFTQLRREAAHANAPRLCFGLDDFEKKYCEAHNFEHIDLTHDVGVVSTEN